MRCIHLPCPAYLHNPGGRAAHTAVTARWRKKRGLRCLPARDQSTMSIEEVVLSTGTIPPAEAGNRIGHETDVALRQHSRTGSCRYTFRLRDRRILSVSRATLFRRPRVYELSICLLNPKPALSLTVGWRHVAAFLVFALALAVTGSSGNIPHAVPLTVALGVCTGLALLLAVCSVHFRLVFCGRNGKIPLVSFLYRNPDRRTFNAFIDTLASHIAGAGCDAGFTDADDALNAELREHRRLMEEGIISAKNYATARSRILGRHR